MLIFFWALAGTQELKKQYISTFLRNTFFLILVFILFLLKMWGYLFSFVK